MELIKISEKQTKLILSEKEAEKYGVKKDVGKNLRAIVAIVAEIEKSSGVNLCHDCVRVKIINSHNGNFEILFSESDEGKRFEVRTFAFDAEGIKKATSALKNASLLNRSALYLYPEKEVYLWEFISRPDSPFPQRLKDFGREINLLSRREFLNVFCHRLDFPKNDT